MRQLNRVLRLAGVGTALIAGSSLFATIPLVAQEVRSTRPPVLIEAWMSRARLAATVAGSRMELDGVGGRVLRSLTPLPADAPRGFARRLALGAFATYAPHDDVTFNVWHYGAAADLQLLARPLAGRIEPLLSLGAGAFRTRRDLAPTDRLTPACLVPMDVPIARAAPSCRRPSSIAPRTASRTDPALSPSLGVRFGVLPGLALRAEVRDVIVYNGAPRHNTELATGVTFVR